MAEKHITKFDLIKVFIRSNFLLGSFNFERMQSMGFCVALIPALRKLYSGEELAAALRRHLEFFNTHPFLAKAIMGIIIAMEEKKANGADIPEATISGVKVGLMGPLAGVGDPIFWGTLRPMLAALGAGIAVSGSVAGPLLFFVVFNVIRLLINYFGVMYGYEKGTELVTEIGGDKIRYLTEGASVLGLFVMGALVAKWTSINMPLVLSEYVAQDGTHVVTTLQSVLDNLMPSIVPLLMTFACMAALKKGVNALLIIVALFAIGIIGYALGILA